MGHTSKRMAAVAVAMLMMSVAATAKVASTFDSDAEGWGVIGPVDGGVSWSALSGNPGGAISVRPTGAGLPAFFVAPAEFLGDQSALIGQKLTFDLRYDYPIPGNSIYTALVELRGAGLTLVSSGSEHEAVGDWHHLSTFLFQPEFGIVPWSVGSIAGGPATPEQFAAVMSDLTALHVHADAYTDVPGTTTIDNVAVVGIPEPSVSALIGLGAVMLLGVGGRRARRLGAAAA